MHFISSGAKLRSWVWPGGPCTVACQMTAMLFLVQAVAQIVRVLQKKRVALKVLHRELPAVGLNSTAVPMAALRT